MAGIFGLVLAAFAIGIFLSRFNALAVVVGSFLLFGCTVILNLMQHSLVMHSFLLGFVAALVLQAGYLAAQVIKRQSSK
jgi:hypothetical protein